MTGHDASPADDPQESFAVIRRRGVERIVSFSNGVFSIAITLLVLQFRVPERLGVNADEELWTEVQDQGSALFAYALSFYAVGRSWIAHHRLFQVVRHVDSGLMWRNLSALALVALLPYPTEVFGLHPTTVTATVLYAAMVSVSGFAGSLLWLYVLRHRGLLDPRTSDRFLWHHFWRGMTMPAVFLSSVPIAVFWSTTAAWWSWTALVPLRLLLARRLGSTQDQFDEERLD